MNALLMYPDRDFDLNQPLPSNAAELIQDLELNTLFAAFALEDEFLLQLAPGVLLTRLCDVQTIVYRQNVLADCIEQPAAVREMYAIACEALERRKTVWGWALGRYPQGVLDRAIEKLEGFTLLLRRLGAVADQHAGNFQSQGFTGFFAMLATQLDSAYLSTVEEHLQKLEFRKGMQMSAQIGKGGRGRHYVVRKPWETKQTWFERVKTWAGEYRSSNDPSSYVYEIADRDEAGFRALSELRDRGIAHIAEALAQSSDHIQSFFTMLQAELGFYIGCLNLRDRLTRKSEPLCFPEPLPMDNIAFSARGMYDVCLSLNVDDRVIGNDVSGDGKKLFMITGANRGGKSTFLRSAGLAQVMMQCGMFVPAESFRANVCHALFTHFKREEDIAMKSGKLDEELSRMNSIVKAVSPGSVVLFNESFASTNEREGSEIARQIVRALLESGIKVVYVTHMFDLAHGFYMEKENGALFLRAERLPDGSRSFRIVEGEPLPTSFGEDLYKRIFGPASKTPLLLDTRGLA